MKSCKQRVLHGVTGTIGVIPPFVFVTFIVLGICLFWSTVRAAEPFPESSTQHSIERPPAASLDDALLLFAASIGSADQTRSLLAGGADYNVRGSNGETPLIIALRNVHFKKILAEVQPALLFFEDTYFGAELLIEKRVQELKSEADALPLPPLVADFDGFGQVARLLLEHGADGALMDKSGTSALHYAASFGFFQAVDLMLAAGVPVDGEIEGPTPLMLASFFGHPDIVRRLIAAGAALNPTIGEGFTPLFFAAVAGYQDIAELLLAAGADSLAMNSSVLNSLAYFWKDSVVSPGSVRYEMVRLLLAHGVDPLVEDGNGVLPLMVVSQGSSPALARLLVAEDRQLARKADVFGWTPLMYAAANRTDELAGLMMAELFVSLGAAVDWVATDGRTPLHVALAEGNEEIAAFLLEKRCRIDLRDSGGMTPLMLAAQRGLAEIAAILLRRGARIDAALPESGITAIHFAAFAGQLPVLDLLLEHGGSVNSRTEEGFTPLLIAIRGCERQRLAQVVRYLLANGADVHAMASGNRNSLSFALERGGLENIVDLLRVHGAELVEIGSGSKSFFQKDS